MTNSALDRWAASQPITDEEELLIPAPPVDPIYAVMTGPERFRAAVLTLVRHDRDRKPPKGKRRIGRKPRQTKTPPETPDALILITVAWYDRPFGVGWTKSRWATRSR